MWQVYYFIAVERQHELQRELDRRRRLEDDVRPAPRGRIGTILRRGRERADAVAHRSGAVLDRPLVGPHHS